MWQKVECWFFLHNYLESSRIIKVEIYNRIMFGKSVISPNKLSLYYVWLVHIDFLGHWDGQSRLVFQNIKSNIFNPFAHCTLHLHRPVMYLMTGSRVGEFDSFHSLIYTHILNCFTAILEGWITIKISLSWKQLGFNSKLNLTY